VTMAAPQCPAGGSIFIVDTENIVTTKAELNGLAPVSGQPNLCASVMKKPEDRERQDRPGLNRSHPDRRYWWRKRLPRGGAGAPGNKHIRRAQKIQSRHRRKAKSRSAYRLTDTKLTPMPLAACRTRRGEARFLLKRCLPVTGRPVAVQAGVDQ